MSDQENIQESISSPKSKNPLVPKIPDSYESCTLTLDDGKSYELPILKGSTGPDCIDGRALYTTCGLYTYDPGFTSTASCVSAITYIDGEKG